MKYVYKHFNTNEIVNEEDAEEYALDHLGITIKPLEKDGSYTQLQIDFLGEFTEWFFSNWVKDTVKDEEEIDYEAAIIDKVYEENLDKRLGVL